jgi:hypothetical protein
MIGVVIGVYPGQDASLAIAGCSTAVRAPLSEIKNASPKRLDLAEVVSCTLVRDRDGLRATAIRILVGKSERAALNGIRPFASWDQRSNQSRLRGGRRD